MNSRHEVRLRPTAAVSSRTCGECSLCCTVLRVDTLRKLGGVPCLHQSEAGCGIHGQPKRPALCGRYRCAWLRGRFEEGDRPDRLGAVLDFVTQGASPLFAIREAERGAFDRSSRLRAIAEAMRGTMPVRITSAADVMNADRPYRLLLAEGEEQVVTGEWVERLRGSECVDRRRMPLLERSVRSVTLWWQRRRLRGYRGACEPRTP